ncbi:MAG: hypothetical protein WB952_25990 [Terriglobales bacterium]
MEIRKPKTLEDFPKFIVTAVRRGTTSDTGYTRFELDGSFDRIIENIATNWFWLLVGEGECLCASLESIDKGTNAAILTCDQKAEPKIVGQALSYLSPYWQAYNVWMVLDPSWGWQKKQFQGIDAVAEDYESKDISIVGGREVKVWTKLEPAGGRGSQSRHYPAADQTLRPGSEARLVPSGWDHEHCDLCKAHIDAGKYGYCDPAQRWMCEKCYERYVVQRDLAFVDEL